MPPFHSEKTRKMEKKTEMNVVKFIWRTGEPDTGTAWRGNKGWALITTSFQRVGNRTIHAAPDTTGLCSLSSQNHSFLKSLIA